MKQITLNPDAKIDLIQRRLLERYGDHPWIPHGDSIGELVNTILSQNTNDRNRDQAFAQLRERFPTWEAVRDAPSEEVINSIRPAGLAPSKGPRIQSALKRITQDQGTLSLEFLSDMPLPEARAWLLALNGVGPKTAAIVLLFALGRPAFPVDTHVHRVTRRLGIIPQNTSREKAHLLMESLVAPSLYYVFHMNLIEHGRQTCKARAPQCTECVLQTLCAYYAQLQEGNPKP